MLYCLCVARRSHNVGTQDEFYLQYSPPPLGGHFYWMSKGLILRLKYSCVAFILLSKMRVKVSLFLRVGSTILHHLLLIENLLITTTREEEEPMSIFLSHVKNLGPSVRWREV